MPFTRPPPFHRFQDFYAASKPFMCLASAKPGWCMNALAKMGLVGPGAQGGAAGAELPGLPAFKVVEQSPLARSELGMPPLPPVGPGGGGSGGSVAAPAPADTSFFPREDALPPAPHGKKARHLE